MASARVLRAWKDGAWAYLEVRVTESDGTDVDYAGKVALGELGGLTAVQQKAALVAAVKAVRDGATRTALGISGTVTV